MIETVLNFIYLLFQSVIIAFVLKDLAAFISDIVIQVAESTRTSAKLAKGLLYLSAYLLSCSKCFTFWFSLILTSNLFLASLAAIIITIVVTILDKHKQTIL